MYDGPPKNLEFYFRSIGFPSPAHTNPADHVMALLIRDEAIKEEFRRTTTMFNRKRAEESNKKLDILISSYHKSMGKKQLQEVIPPCPIEEFENLKKPTFHSNFVYNFFVVWYRIYITYFLDPMKLVAYLIQLVGLSTLIILVFLYAFEDNTEFNTIAKIQNMKSLLFQLMQVMTFSGFYNGGNGIIPYLNPFKIEYNKRLYSPALFYFVLATYQIPITIFMLFFYLMSMMIFLDLNSTDLVENFVKFMIALFFANFSTAAFGELVAIFL